jgi:hypothetical protein
MLRSVTLMTTLGALLVGSAAASAQTVADTSAITAALGRPGTVMPGNVYRVGLPRTDLAVTRDGVPLRPGFALGGYAAFEALPDGKTLVVGDLCLLEREIETVMTQLQKEGIEVTALHNHLRNESPHVMFMHFLGTGNAATLAQGLRRAVTMTGTLSAVPPSPSAEPAAFAVEIQRIIGRPGNSSGGVFSISVPRAEHVTVRGMPLTPGMGVTNILNVEDAGNGRVATTGDFVLVGSEVNPTIAALRSHGFEVTAMHQHMIGDEPTLYYVHFWRVGSPADVGGGLKDALSHVHVAT